MKVNYTSSELFYDFYTVNQMTKCNGQKKIVKIYNFLFIYLWPYLYSY